MVDDGEEPTWFPVIFRCFARIWPDRSICATCSVQFHLLLSVLPCFISLITQCTFAVQGAFRVVCNSGFTKDISDLSRIGLVPEARTIHYHGNSHFRVLLNH